MYDIHPDYWSDALIDALPELRPGYRSMLDQWGRQSPGAHIVYGDLLNPLLIALLKDVDRNRNELSRIFGVLEKLASNGDEHVKNVIGATVFERLAGERLLQAARGFMGPVLQEIASPLY